MLVTDIRDQMCWRQLCDGFGHLLSPNSSPTLVSSTKIQKLSPIQKNFTNFVTNIHLLPTSLWPIFKIVFCPVIHIDVYIDFDDFIFAIKDEEMLVTIGDVGDKNSQNQHQHLRLNIFYCHQLL